MKAFSVFCLIALTSLISLPALAVVGVPLVWNPSPDDNVAGYKVYYGLKSHAYTSSVDVGNVTNTTVTGLTEGNTYYFAATTYNTAGVESDLSNEAVYTAPAVVAPSVAVTQNAVAGQSVSLSAAGQGTGPLNYQWKFNSTIIASGTNATLNLGQVLAGQSGIYSVTVTDTNGNSTNIAANLTIYSTAAATLTQPAFANGQYSFHVEGVDGYQYIIERSTNLTDWAEVQQVTAPFTFVDTNAGRFGQCFYRTRGFFPIVTSYSGLTANTTISPAKAILSQPVYANGQCSFNVSGTSGLQYVVQASTDLVNWVSLQTNTAPFSFTDANAGSFSQRFYRTFALTNAPSSALTVNLAVSTSTAAALTNVTCANGQYSFTVNGMVGREYVVQATTNLVDWVSVATNTAPFNYVDSQAGQFQQRFFRAF